LKRSAPTAGASATAAITATETTPPPTAVELINEGLKERQMRGVAAAQPFFERAAQLEPHFHLPFFMLGNVASELGDLDSAVAHYERARGLQPNDHVIRYNLGLNQLWRGFVDLSLEQLRAACELNPEYLPAQSTYLLALHQSDRISPEEIAAATRAWGTRFAQQQSATAVGSAAGADVSGFPGGAVLGVGAASRMSAVTPGVLRVGFISGDFRTHSVAHFFEPIASARDRGAFTYFFYSTATVQDAVTGRMRGYADEWRDVSQLGADALIELIRADGIDVLVDLSGHTDLNRLAVFARRAAPVQITYLGYPDSTGLANMDYRITDAITDPEPDADRWHTERLLRLPVSQWCFRQFGTAAAPGPLPAREAGFVTFGSFNNITKVSDTVLECWVQILLKSPTSRLRLTRMRSKERAADIVEVFRRAGVAAERIECAPFLSDVPHGRQFAGVDIALDPFPYNGVTTTCESLYFGLPVITLYGRNGVSRSGLSLLSSLGLSELAASSPGAYVGIAVELAADLDRLESLRTSLRARVEQSSLRDERRFAAHFGELLRTAYRSSLPGVDSDNLLVGTNPA
jgi:hypothetical protein